MQIRERACDVGADAEPVLGAERGKRFTNSLVHLRAEQSLLYRSSRAVFKDETTRGAVDAKCEQPTQIIVGEGRTEFHLLLKIETKEDLR